MRFFDRLLYKNRKFNDDDFDWDNYTRDSYERRIEQDIETQFYTGARDGVLSFDAATGHIHSTGKSLHPNHRLLFEIIGQLQPASVHEVGCGGGDHLANGMALYPSTVFTGGDRGETQLKLALERHPELAGKIGLQDITMPFSRLWPKAELVITQAVLMHIHTAVSHFVGLANIVRQAQKYVLLIENLQCHNFVKDITQLWQGGHLEWPELHIHHAGGANGALAILLSKEQLDLPLVASDEALREGLKSSPRRLKRASEDSNGGIFGFA